MRLRFTFTISHFSEINSIKTSEQRKLFIYLLIVQSSFSLRYRQVKSKKRSLCLISYMYILAKELNKLLLGIWNIPGNWNIHFCFESVVHQKLYQTTGFLKFQKFNDVYSTFLYILCMRIFKYKNLGTSYELYINNPEYWNMLLLF